MWGSRHRQGDETAAFNAINSNWFAPADVDRRGETTQLNGIPPLLATGGCVDNKVHRMSVMRPPHVLYSNVKNVKNGGNGGNPSTPAPPLLAVYPMLPFRFVTFFVATIPKVPTWDKFLWHGESLHTSEILDLLRNHIHILLRFYYQIRNHSSVICHVRSTPSNMADNSIRRKIPKTLKNPQDVET